VYKASFSLTAVVGDRDLWFDFGLESPAGRGQSDRRALFEVSE
jgi:hypothetical protein